MTTFSVPTLSSVPTLPNKGYSPAQWREIYPKPPNARFDIGTYCPLDDTLLRVRLDGWTCPLCRAAWDFRGLSGRWLPLPDTAEVSRGK